MSESCESCRFYDWGGVIGYCRRYPPTLTGWKKHEGQQVGFPVASPTDWCGEYQVNDAGEEEEAPKDEGPYQWHDFVKWDPESVIRSDGPLNITDPPARESALVLWARLNSQHEAAIDPRTRFTSPSAADALLKLGEGPDPRRPWPLGEEVRFCNAFNGVGHFCTEPPDHEGIHRCDVDGWPLAAWPKS
jgi:hypothetical protein